MGNINLITIFFTGLFTGGLTCMAVQGGLLAATIAQQEEEKLKQKVRGCNAVPIFAFLGAKLIAYTLLGFLLGWFGSFFQLSILTKAFLQIAVSIFMIGAAGNILNIHPLFRYFILQPPKFLTRLVRKQSKSNDIFAPLLLGSFTVFIPCGTTQVIMALAVASGKPLIGALILCTFILGTSPIFFLLGYFTTKLGDALHAKFMKIAAIAIIILAVFNLNNAVALTGNNTSLGTVARNFWCFFTFCPLQNVQGISIGNPLENPMITINDSGYTPNNFSVKANSQVNITLVNKSGAGCTQAFTIPSLNIQKLVPLGSSDILSFHTPSEPGDVQFMCSAGMYRGIMHIVKA